MEPPKMSYASQLNTFIVKINCTLNYSFKELKSLSILTHSLHFKTMTTTQVCSNVLHSFQNECKWEYIKE